MRTALMLALLTAAPALAAPAYTLVVVDSRGLPADDLALEAWRQTRHRRSRCGFRWIRVGAPEAPSPGSATAGEVPPEAGGPRPPPVKPEWDPEGEEVSAWALEGVPRILLVDSAGRVLVREVFLPVPDLRYLVRHPAGFPSNASTTRIRGSSRPPAEGSEPSPE